MKPVERQRVVAHLEMTGSWLLDEVAKLSDAQMTYRSAADQWSVAEVVQHLVLAEPNYWKILQDRVHQEPQELKQKPTDADALWYGIDRTQHSKTSEKQDPKGQSVNLADAIKSFRQLHAKLLDYAKSTNDDLRGHTVPEWGMDAYQCLLVISTHEQRHILQIREIKS